MLNSPITISELTRRIKSVVENEFSFVYVTGEISNFKHHSSGHFYFTLKDDKSQISATMWSSRNKELFFTPENGMKIIIKGRITLYETRGSYQIDVFEMEPAGAGELQVAFEKLKQKLYEEGLFDKLIKKKIPEFPERVAIITSETGAALQDFINVTKKRYPIVKLFLLSANVQGAGAAGSICKAIRIANRPGLKLDIIILARGGGSIEDLWSFNDENLAREIHRSKIPVVSAIGHEIDFTISDFVADLRAPTPSAAAEIIFPDRNELLKRSGEYSDYLKNLVKIRFSNMGRLLDSVSGNYYFKKTIDVINEYKYRLDDMQKILENVVKEKITYLGRCLDTNEKLLYSINPDQVLKRGFTIVIKDKKIISRRERIKKFDNIKIRFYDGDTNAIITESFKNKQ